MFNWSSPKEVIPLVMYYNTKVPPTKLKKIINLAKSHDSVQRVLNTTFIDIRRNIYHL